MIKTFYKKYKFHLVVWGIYILYEVFLLGLFTNSFKQPGTYFIIYLTNIITFYTHAFFLNKVLSNSNSTFKIIKIAALIVLGSLTYIALSYVLATSFAKVGIIKVEVPTELNKAFILACIYRSLYFIGFSTGYVYIIQSLKERRKVAVLEKQNLVTQIEKQTLENDLVQSQNNYLRSQINPHFLFNTLNFIYNDARKKAPMAADAIMNLAEMMRYALKRPEASEMVPLSEEIEQIEHLINLHKLRTADNINLDLQVTGDLFGLRFPPLILLTLVENIFKHGNVSHSTQPVQIKIIYEKNNLNITTINMVNDVAKKQVESHHVGIENIDKRLNNFYGEEYVFRYYKDPLNRFITEIDVAVVNPMAKLNRQMLP
ncbi:sensor histidine kinase [Pedobacter rhizosphaerae]|uniref:Histidine kinase n=1 Tax=Pedobacter rhizosphaerae TaxID=390241 RepID=A0A1H9LBK3_9SPHI|nr:sensor histidine kinase [Pedobacter rhizosphaerae]SER08577.1 Histidine kinase [Pedobacter rhizosphaerae]